MREHLIYDGDAVVGTARVRREGMYLVLRCCCHWNKQEPQRISLTTMGKTIDLGLCVPEGTQMSLLRRISVKQFDEENAQFALAKNERGCADAFCTDRPFADIAKLPEARLNIRDGAAFVLFSDQSSSSPTGQ